jgi:hypothetical protein
MCNFKSLSPEIVILGALLLDLYRSRQ